MKCKSWICLIAASISAPALAADYTAYRLGNYSQAFEELNQQSGKDPVADYYLGRLYLYGYGQLKNEALAIHFFNQAAEKGYLPALLFMGQYSLYIKQNPQMALGWFKKAAEKGDLSAKMYMAAAYLYGFGVSENKDAARQYYIAAAKEGNAIAQYTLAKHFLDSKSPSNYRLGVIWLTKAATEGKNLRAQTKLAKVYLGDRYMKADLVKAQDLLSQAISQNYPPAMVVYGDLELKKEDYMKARDWYQKAADLNSKSAQVKLAHLYFNPKNPFRDDHTGFLWMLKAAQSNSIEGQKELAALYKEGKGTEKDPLLSSEWLKKAEETKKAKPGLSADHLAARWLNNGISTQWDQLPYQPKGIYTSWQNKAALRDTIYNQSPQLQVFTREALFQPKFELTQPNEIALSEFYDALVKTENTLQAKKWFYPVHSLNKHIRAQLQTDNFTLQRHSSILPYRDDYQLPQQSTFATEALVPWINSFDKNTNYLAIFNDLYNRAILGDAESQFYVGQMFQYGLGVMQSDEQAITFYEKAAIQQHLAAQYTMGVLYLKHKNNPELYNRGVDWLVDAAFKGNRNAQFVLADVLLENQPVKTPMASNEQALSMLYLSAANEYGIAQYELAEELTHQKQNDLNVTFQNERRNVIRQLYLGAVEKGVAQAYLPLAFFNAMDSSPTEQKKAFEVAKKEADTGNPKAALLLAILYDRGIGVAPSQEMAMQWYQKAGDNVVSRFILGTYASEGRGTTKDITKGISLLKQAAGQEFSYAVLNLAVLNQQVNQPFLPELIKAYSLNNPKAGLLLADYYLTKPDNAETLQQAIAIYTGLAEKGDQYAQLKLGYMFDKGIGSQANPEKAMQWYLASAEQGNSMAQYQLGQFYQLGEMGDPDYTKALEWYKKSAKERSEALVAIGFIEETVNDNYAEALKAYQQASRQGNTIADYNLALMYEYGKGIPVNYQKAKEYYAKAASEGVSVAMNQLAGLYFYGLGVARDTEEALAWYEKAAAMGEGNALYQLGLFSETGVAQKLDYPAAISYYQKAAEKGNDKAKIALARMYQYGIGTTKDKHLAMGLYQQLAERNNAYAQYQLGTFYIEGIGGERQPDMGKVWLEKASHNGNKEAQKVLQRLEAQSKERVSFVEPVLLNKATVASGQPADMIYFNALSEWNRGDETLSRMILQRLRAEFPDYPPAKLANERLNQAMLDILAGQMSAMG